MIQTNLLAKQKQSHRHTVTKREWGGEGEMR